MKIRSIERKGQVGGLSASVVALGVAAIVLVLMLVILQELRDTSVVSNVASDTVINETLTSVEDNTGEDLNPIGAGFCQPVCTITNVANASEIAEIPASNYTTSNSGCTIKFTDGNSEGFNNSDWNVSYTVTKGDQACSSANLTLVGVGTFADFWVIIVLAIVAAVVIGIIFGAFGGLARRAR